MHIYYSDHFTVELPPGHRFPMDKYPLLRQQLQYEGSATLEQLISPRLITDEQIQRTHCPAYWQRLQALQEDRQVIRRVGFPQNEKQIRRARAASSGTFRAAEHALRYGAGVNLAGGTHHAYRDRGEGYCFINDVAISANWLLHTGQVRRVLVVDLDVHQGNGTAKLFQAEPRVFTYSMHGAGNYPFHKEESDLDIALPNDTGDQAYLEHLREVLPRLIAKQQPDIIYYLAGADVLATDRLGKLALTKDGARARDEYVCELAWKHQIPLVAVMGGGYSPRVADVVDAHANTVRTVLQMWD